MEQVAFIILSFDRDTVGFVRWPRREAPTLLVVRVGDSYRVEPRHPHKLRHRGRTVRVTAILYEPKRQEPTHCKFAFEDGGPGRWGTAEFDDLCPLREGVDGLPTATERKQFESYVQAVLRGREESLRL